MAKSSKTSVLTALSSVATGADKPAPGLRKGKSKRIPYSALFLGADNVRNGEPDPAGIVELAALIEAQGLLNGLQVTEEVKKGVPTGRHGVEAGGRRFSALGLLLRKGVIAADELIDCTVIDAVEATEVSLAENVGQEPMHPVDEYAGYKKMVDEQGLSAEAIAGKFGVTLLHVQRRLKLAAVEPRFLAMYRAGTMQLDQVMALASVDDQARQVMVWNSLSSYSRSAHNIKQRLTEQEVQDNDARVKVVGLKNYLAAGGVVRADLFSDKGTQYLTDPGLLDMLVGEVLEAKAEAVRAEGWSWVEVMPEFGYQERQKFGSMPARYLPESEKVAQQRKGFEAQIAEYEAKMDADEEGDTDFYEEISALEKKIEALKEARLDPAGIDKALAGAVVFIEDKKVAVTIGLVRAADAAKVKKQIAEAGGDEPDDMPTKAERPDVPERLMLNLSSHRTAAVQALMLKNERVALVALAFKMAASVLGESYGRDGQSPVSISLTQSRYALEKNSTTIGSCAAITAFDAERAVWKERMPAEQAQWFAWLLEQPQEVVLSLIVFATANTVDMLQTRTDSFTAAAPLATALGLDMADWWAPTADNYLSMVPKDKIAQAVTDAKGAAAAEPLAKMKKQEAVIYAAQQLEGTRWLPLVLRAVPGIES